MESRKGGTFGAALIICGTCIGGGMLALPSATSAGGFLPSLVSNVGCWLFMMLTGFLLMEACLWLPERNVHLPSLARVFLGRPGQLISCGLFVFLYYCLLISYISGGSPYFTRFLAYGLGADSLPAWLGTGVYVGGLAGVLLLGNRAIDRVNVVLMAGLFISFAALLIMGSSAVTTDNLMFQDWSQTWMATPILFGAYGYHNVIPSLAAYLDKDGKKLRRAIVVGTGLPLVIYCLWQAVALGIIPHAELQAASMGSGIPIVESMIGKTELPGLTYVVYFFSFFAIVTSILGVAFSMLDFLLDGLRLAPRPRNRFAVTLLTLAPPAVVASVKPGLFLEVFGYASGYGEAILNGCIPVVIFWIGYKVQAREAKYSPLRERPALVCLFLLAVAVMLVESWHIVRS